MRELQPPSDSKSEIATENTESTDPNLTPKAFFPFAPPHFRGRGRGEGGTPISGVGLWGSVDSVAKPRAGKGPVAVGSGSPCFPWLNPGPGRALWRSGAAPD